MGTCSTLSIVAEIWSEFGGRWIDVPGNPHTNYIQKVKNLENLEKDINHLINQKGQEQEKEQKKR